MTFEETLVKANSVRWKVEECGTHDCWCRIVTTEELIFHTSKYGDEEVEEELYLIGAGGVDKVQAEHIVELQNKYCESKL